MSNHLDLDNIREPDLHCPVCGLKWPPARLNDFDPSGTCVVPVDRIRCVECKTDFDRPLTDEQLDLVQKLVQKRRDDNQRFKDNLKKWLDIVE